MLYIKAIFYAITYGVYEFRAYTEWLWIRFTLWAEEQVAFHDGGAKAVSELWDDRRNIGENDGNQLSELRSGTDESTTVDGQRETAERTE